MVDFYIKPVSCPGCKAQTKFVTAPDYRAPIPGDYIFCGPCGALLRWTGALDLVLVTEKEIAALPGELQNSLEMARTRWKAIWKN